MNNAFNMSSLNGKRTSDVGIDWEFQPSLHHLVVRPEPARRDAPMWAETMPAALESLREPDPFHEPLQGLSIREVHEPEIFKLFFGEADRRAARA
jgi:hypothetical protein